MKQVSDVTAVVLSKSSSNGSWFVLNIIKLAGGKEKDREIAKDNCIVIPELDAKGRCIRIARAELIKANCLM